MEFSEDAKIIYSGHDDANVRRWDVNPGESIGKPISGHTEGMDWVAIRGNLIVSGYSDWFLHYWNATTGESIGTALQGNGDDVTCVTLSGDGKLIVWFAGWGYKNMGLRYRKLDRFSFKNIWER